MLALLAVVMVVFLVGPWGFVATAQAKSDSWGGAHRVHVVIKPPALVFDARHTAKHGVHHVASPVFPGILRDLRARLRDMRRDLRARMDDLRHRLRAIPARTAWTPPKAFQHDHWSGSPRHSPF
jgi:xanthine/CO dehydrogenase XdhC/CoxF family maturation factor